MADKCGAKTRAGGRCRKPKMPNGRCRLHGGMSTGPKVPNTRRNAFKLGLYCKNLLPGELAMYRAIKLGNIDDEIRLNRVRLNRVLAAEANAEAGALEVAEVITRDLVGFGAKREEKSVPVDYHGLIEQLSKRIESLEMTRAKLLQAAEGIPDDDEDKGPIGRIVVEVRSARPTHDNERAAG